MTGISLIISQIGIAAATDGAVTMSNKKSSSTDTDAAQSGSKVFEGSEKIIGLTPHSVMVMTTGDYCYMTVPIIDVLKLYNAQLTERNLARLSDYPTDFLKFLRKFSQRIPESAQKDYFQLNLRRYFDDMQEEAKEAIIPECRFDPYGSIKKVIRKKHKILLSAPFQQSFTNEHLQVIRRRYRKVISDAIDETFDTVDLGKEWRAKLRDIAACFLIKEFSEDNCPYMFIELIWAGYGDSELHPSYYSILLSGVLLNEIVWQELESESIDFNRRAIVTAFSSALDDLSCIMYGMRPELETRVGKMIESLVAGYIAETESIMERRNLPDVKGIKKELGNAGRKLSRDALRDIAIFGLDSFYIPLYRAVSCMPKKQMGELAAFLVTMTASRQKFTTDTKENVGGDITTMTLSRGSGMECSVRGQSRQKNIDSIDLTQTPSIGVEVKPRLGPRMTPRLESFSAGAGATASRKRRS